MKISFFSKSSKTIKKCSNLQKRQKSSIKMKKNMTAEFVRVTRKEEITSFILLLILKEIALIHIQNDKLPCNLTCNLDFMQIQACACGIFPTFSFSISLHKKMTSFSLFLHLLIVMWLTEEKFSISMATLCCVKADKQAMATRQ